MRLAYVCADPGVPVFGRKGCSVHVQEILRSFVRLGACVDLFAARVGGDTPRGLELVRVHRLPLPGTSDTARRERAALDANDSLRIALERRGPFDLVYERYSLWSFAGMRYANAASIPGLLEVNAPLIDEQARHRSLADRAAAARVAANVFREAGEVLAVSAEVAAAISGYTGPRRHIHIVPNGVDVRRFRPDIVPSCPGKPGAFTVGFVGTLKPWHGLRTLVDAFDMLAQRHEDVRLLVVGAGPGLTDLQSDLAARRLLAISHLTGAVDPADVPSLLTSATVAAAPYSDESGFYFSPLKLFEYMAAGLPVVASRLGQMAAIIEHEVCGLLCPADDSRALLSAFERLYRDRALRERLGGAARVRAVREHSWDSVCRAVVKIAGLQHAEGAQEAHG
jgi:glycosyltransferase involved in cell wall biosynthesis